ncbi:MAG: hypothetical protein Nkreftii_000054 [Candidatus Nitrospira kreftii]|uniref:Uncharacterized protein n=1 Tax=Candidatus Nitrospira kreftii TaxID=2652173 RepID=A0A7S8IXT9_9BACT|nr:MAG: hypothetical protein Nkreftii_000054 [Candidatus Nitrospira kreftii]
MGRAVFPAGEGEVIPSHVLSGDQQAKEFAIGSR